MKVTVNTPEGTRDRLFAECQERRQVQECLIQLFRQRGFWEVSTPATEFYDLYACSGSALAQERMVKVDDPSGKFCVMRPDSTTPIARVAASVKLVEDTVHGDAQAVAQQIERVHAEWPSRYYNTEAESF